LAALARRFPDPPLYPPTPVQQCTSFLVELYADEFLILPGLHYRWSTEEGERRARQEFAIMTADAPRANKFASAVRMFTRLVGVQEGTIPAIEAHTLELLAALEAHFAEHAFLPGAYHTISHAVL